MVGNVKGKVRFSETFFHLALTPYTILDALESKRFRSIATFFEDFLKSITFLSISIVQHVYYTINDMPLSRLNRTFRHEFRKKISSGCALRCTRLCRKIRLFHLFYFLPQMGQLCTSIYTSIYTHTEQF